MGANQSSQAAPTESLYDILGVDRNATEIELKKAYKKKALLLHPDRNFNKEEEATTQFTKVQAAYDVLSNPQERAWYDSHGTTDGSAGEQEFGGKVTSTDELKKYFEPAWWQRLDDPAEFYELVNQLFNQLRQEEEEAALDNGEEAPILPSFGNSDSQWNRDIKPFYDTWSSFSSIKSFAWEDVYRAWATPDRRTRRAAEQRNKKIREAAKKEFNKTVRELVTVVRQKDPRVKEHNKQKKKAPSQQAAKEQAKRDREANAARRETYQQQEWEKVNEDEFKEAIGEGQEEDEEVVVDIFECIVCDKVFKTKKQLSTHEASKKHKKALAQLKREMRKEGIDLGIDEAQNDSDLDESDVEYDDVDKNVESRIKQEKDRREQQHHEEQLPQEPSSNRQTPDPSEQNGDNKEKSKQEDEDGENEEEEEDDGESNVKTEPTLEELLAELEGTRISGNVSPEPEVKVKGKAKQRRQKRQKATNEFANKCSVCQTEFSSRNKLFQHVKQSGHAAPVPRKR